MRLYTLLIYLLSNIFFLLHAGEPQMTWEIEIKVYNTNQLQNKEFKFTSLSAVWNDQHMLTDDFNMASGVTNSRGLCGFDILDTNSGPNRSIGLGLYELRCISSSYQTVMYIDLRDCGVTSNWNNTIGSLDFNMKNCLLLQYTIFRGSVFGSIRSVHKILNIPFHGMAVIGTEMFYPLVSTS